MAFPHFRRRTSFFAVYIVCICLLISCISGCLQPLRQDLNTDHEVQMEWVEPISYEELKIFAGIPFDVSRNETLRNNSGFFESLQGKRLLIVNAATGELAIPAAIHGTLALVAVPLDSVATDCLRYNLAAAGDEDLDVESKVSVRTRPTQQNSTSRQKFGDASNATQFSPFSPDTWDQCLEPSERFDVIVVLLPDDDQPSDADAARPLIDTALQAAAQHLRKKGRLLFGGTSKSQLQFLEQQIDPETWINGHLDKQKNSEQLPKIDDLPQRFVPAR